MTAAVHPDTRAKVALLLRLVAGAAEVGGPYQRVRADLAWINHRNESIGQEILLRVVDPLERSRSGRKRSLAGRESGAGQIRLAVRIDRQPGCRVATGNDTAATKEGSINERNRCESVRAAQYQQECRAVLGFVGIGRLE